MNILHIMPYSPVPPQFGGALRVYHMLRALSARHSVTVLTFGSERDAEAIRREFPRAAVRTVPPPWPARFRRAGQAYAAATGQSYFAIVCRSAAMQRMIDEVASGRPFDIVQSEFALMGLYRLPEGPVKVLDAHNIEFDNFRQMWLHARTPLRKSYYRGEFTRFRSEEVAAWRRADAIFATSEADRELLGGEAAGTTTFVIPNGTDTAYFTPEERAPEAASAIFTGMMGYVPNYDGMLWFLDEVFPLIVRSAPAATVTIAGGSPPPQLTRRASAAVRVTGLVDDIRPLVRRAAVFVVPLRMGSGTRLKVLEAMAMGIPIVTTSVGCAGIDVRDGESVFIADTPERFAACVVELFANPGLGRALAGRALALVRSRYDWSVIGARLDEAFHHIAGGGVVRPALRERNMA